MDSIPEQWSAQEMAMVNVVDVFHHKPAIMKKAEKYLTQLKEGLIANIADNHESFPDGVDLAKGQFARGENHKGFPFISMDMPQQFSSQATDSQCKARVVADYIAGMTDRFAISEYERLN